MAGAKILGRSLGATVAAAAAVIRLATATGPTASAREVPKIAYSTERRDRGIQPDLGRQSNEHGVGQRLRDQHDGDNRRDD